MSTGKKNLQSEKNSYNLLVYSLNKNTMYCWFKIENIFVENHLGMFTMEEDQYMISSNMQWAIQIMQAIS